jgi:hypothetical protein
MVGAQERLAVGGGAHLPRHHALDRESARPCRARWGLHVARPQPDPHRFEFIGESIHTLSTCVAPL